jgi:uncharacterized protein
VRHGVSGFAAVLGTLGVVGSAAAQHAPIADHHQHLFSPAIAEMAGPSSGIHVVTARDLILLLDSAGIRKAVLLSFAYSYGKPGRNVPDEYAKVRAENDWVAAQAAEYPDRLIAFCGFNPLKAYAVEELERCAGDARFGRGIKLHFGNSDVQLDDSAQVEQLARVFRSANAHRMAIVVHMRANLSKNRPYGAKEARVFLERLLPLVPDVTVQVAHLAGTGPGYDDPPADSAMAVLADAVRRRDPRTRRLFFDLSGIVTDSMPAAEAARMVKRIRQAGVARILYGSDAPLERSQWPREEWAAVARLPLTRKELARIASNVAPYLR